LSTAAPPTRRRSLQVAVGVVLVVLAFVGVLVFSRLSGGPAAASVTIEGASRDIKTGTVVVAADLTTIAVETVPTGAVRDPGQLVGKIARHDVTKGVAVLDSDVASPAIGTATKLYFALPAGKVALNIPASDISPYVQPGDQIDIIASPKQQGSPQYKVTIKALRVLSVGAPAAAGGTAAGGNLIVEATLQDAESIQFLIKNTDFTYVLRSPLDQSTPDPGTTGVDLPTFKQIYGFK
jgi:Flp pilus assembly protein CpaB